MSFNSLELADRSIGLIHFILTNNSLGLYINMFYILIYSLDSNVVWLPLNLLIIFYKSELVIFFDK